MKRILCLLLAAVILTGCLVSCNPAAPVDTDDTADTADTSDTAETSDTPSAETEPPVEEKKPYEEAVVAEYDGYTVTLSEPIVVYQGNEGDDAWGHTNFPSVSRTAEGFLRVRWSYGDDVVGGKSVSYTKISMNEGKSWLPLNASASSAPPNKVMANGKCWGGFVSAGTPTSKELAEMIPDSEKLDIGSGRYLLYAEDLEKYDLAKEMNLTGLSMREYDPETGTYETIKCTLNWPYAPVTIYPKNIFYTVSGLFGLSGSNVIVTDDGCLYTCIYGYGFDSSAESREESVCDYTKSGRFWTFLFESTDSGRTWNYLSQLAPEGTDLPAFCEPKMIEMPDGSFFMLMRTDGNYPIYSARSTDRGKTWTDVGEFDYCGVLPQLLYLDCGVTIASYGRPDLLVRTTDDPAGIEWEEHINVPLANTTKNYMQRSCFYTSLLAIDETSAWFCYTDFKYPNKNGVPVKSVILRKITVTMDE